jgi:hypothetical protein
VAVALVTPDCAPCLEASDWVTVDVRARKLLLLLLPGGAEWKQFGWKSRMGFVSFSFQVIDFVDTYGMRILVPSKDSMIFFKRFCGEKS